MVCADNRVVIPMRACDRGKSEARGTRSAEGAPCEDRFVVHARSSALTPVSGTGEAAAGYCRRVPFGAIALPPGRAAAWCTVAWPSRRPVRGSNHSITPFSFDWCGLRGKPKQRTNVRKTVSCTQDTTTVSCMHATTRNPQLSSCTQSNNSARSES